MAAKKQQTHSNYYAAVLCGMTVWVIGAAADHLRLHSLVGPIVLWLLVGILCGLVFYYSLRQILPGRLALLGGLATYALSFRSFELTRNIFPGHLLGVFYVQHRLVSQLVIAIGLSVAIVFAHNKISKRHPHLIEVVLLSLLFMLIVVPVLFWMVFSLTFHF